MISSPIYKRGTDGKLRTWQYEVEDHRYRTIAGIQGGSLVTSAWTHAEPRNAGKANYTTAYEQAAIEAAAEEKKKLKREYRRTIAELDSVSQGPMLADTYKGNLKWPVFSQPKLDGIRALISKDGAFTRELQPHFNVAHIMLALKPLFERYPDLILDGELYNHTLKDNFNRICQLVRKQTVTDAQRADIEQLVQFHVYDLADAKEPFGARVLAMEALSREVSPGAIAFVPTHKVSSQDALDALNARYTSQGYEGQMVRLDAPYEFDTRSKTLLKRKEFSTAEFPVVRIEEGEGNWAGHAKRIVIRLKNGAECGAGMRGSQEFACDLLDNWNARAHPMEATIRYFGETPDGMLRFPVAIDFHQNARAD
jgi:DNA ligase-1